MKKQHFLLLAILTTVSGFAQIEFEKAYFINNSNQKIECFIKDIDWLDNPIDIKYKLSEDSNYETADIKYVKEFGINNKSKYIRNRVEIDRSSNNLTGMSRTSVPSFNKEELFLKVLVEGKANLYEYIDGNLTRYFYSIENSKIKQLVHKEYINTVEDKIDLGTYKEVISENNYYKQQLWNELKCSYFTENKLKNINYKKKDLVVFFTEYSNCNNEKAIVIKNQEVTKDFFKLTIRPRLNNSSLSVENDNDSSKNTDFGNRIGFGLGLEAEFILPFNKKKWSFLIEPTYQNYKSEKASNVDTPYEGILTRKVDYNSIEIPFSLRHYFFFKENSKFFVNTSLVTNFKLNSSIKYYINNISMSPIEIIETRINFALGIGYKYKDRYSLEIRHQTKREILGKSMIWSSDYKTLSMIFGYSIF
jgi:hypothetical protein